MVNSINYLNNPYLNNYNALDTMCVTPNMNFNSAGSVNFGSMNSIFPSSVGGYSPYNNMMAMETNLYGGGTYNSPSFLNGYTNYPQMSLMNPINMHNTLNSPTNLPTMSGRSSTQTNATSEAEKLVAAQRLIQKHSILNSPSQQPLGANLATGAIMGTAMVNPRWLVHPFNTISACKDVDLKAVKTKDSALNKLWNKNHVVMEEAYHQLHKLEARNKSKLGMFRKRYDPGTDEYNKLKKMMRDAIQDAQRTGDVTKVAKASATLKQAYVNNGWFFRIFKGKKNLPSATQVLREAGNSNSAAAKEISKYTKELLNPTLKTAWKHSGGFGALLFGGLEIFCNFNKIKAAYGSSKEEGKEQLKQTVKVAAANTLGWAAGETLSRWAFAKWGARIGTFFGPGIGTAIGGIVGFLGGTIAMHFAGKAAKKCVGQDVADPILSANQAREKGMQSICDDIIKNKDTIFKGKSEQEIAQVIKDMETIGYNPMAQSQNIPQYA